MNLKKPARPLRPDSSARENNVFGPPLARTDKLKIFSLNRKD
jgi:hypothetical protein